MTTKDAAEEIIPESSLAETGTTEEQVQNSSSGGNQEIQNDNCVQVRGMEVGGDRADGTEDHHHLPPSEVEVRELPEMQICRRRFCISVRPDNPLVEVLWRRWEMKNAQS